MATSPAKSKKKRVTFKLLAPEAREVFVAGSFNDWAPAERALKRNQDGLWTTWMNLAPGTYEYRFVVDGEWLEDPDSEHRSLNTLGSHNSIVKV